MRKMSLCLFVTFTCVVSFANTSSYKDVTRVECSSKQNKIVVDVANQKISGTISDSQRTFVLTNDNADLPSQEVGVLENFLESGFDILGGIVITTDFESSFGTFGLIIENELTNLNKQMMVIYVEAMSGYQINKTMDCKFSKK